MNTQQIPREQQTRDSVPAPVAAGNELVLFRILSLPASHVFARS